LKPLIIIIIIIIIWGSKVMHGQYIRSMDRQLMSEEDKIKKERRKERQ
jgi:predicted Holliday junction resolvase-like endonuclease